MKYGEYKVSLSEGKLSVETLNGDLLAAAAKCVHQALASNSYNPDIPENGSCVPLLNILPLYDGHVSAVCDCGDGAWEVIADCNGPDELEKYIEKLKSEGFEQVCRRNVLSNHFVKFVKDEAVVRVLYLPYLSDIRIIIEKNTVSPVADNGTGSPVFGNTTVTQIGLGCEIKSVKTPEEAEQISMCYVIRLHDGSFIVYDGGMAYAEYADRLYSVLSRQSAGREIHIAAWILTHAHPDHTGVLELFCERYTDRIRVGKFVCNFPSDIQTAGTSPALLVYQNRIKKCMAAFPGAEVVKAYTGDILTFCGAQIEVLYAQELFLPTYLNCLNAASLVTRLTSDGVSLLFASDHADQETPYQNTHFNKGAIRGIYGEYLKSDFVQVSHHGLGGGGTNAFYELVGADYAFWPVGQEKYEKYSLGSNTRNAYFRKDGVKTFLAFDGVQVCTLEGAEIRYEEYATFDEYEEKTHHDAPEI